jgi:ketosteroid isomerase-like protein
MDHVAAVRRMWDAWARGDLEGAFGTDPDTEWHLEGGQVVLRGRQAAIDYVTAAARTGERRDISLYDISAAGPSEVVVEGALRISRDGHLTESQLTWLYSFDAEGRLRRVSGHTSRAEALRALTTYA